MNGILHNKRILVTGGTTGIGHATALLAAQAGADVAFCGLTEEGAAETTRTIEAAGRRAFFRAVDLSNLDDARQFAEAIHARHPGKLLAYNCSPSFNWKAKLDEATIAKFQRELGAMGYKFQFVTLAGFHSLNHAMFELASAYRDEGMAAYSRLQQAEFASEAAGYTATRHQREVGTGYFDKVALTLSAGASSTTALAQSTEADQFTAVAA